MLEVRKFFYSISLDSYNISHKDVLRRISYHLNNNLHREDGPAVEEYYPNGNKKMEIWGINGEHFRKDGGPTYIQYYSDGTSEYEMWGYGDNIKHRIDAPAIIKYDNNGNIVKQWFYENGVEIIK